ncbi:hypothetical protein A6U87_14950 [Rhizobium sp. AC44/96]|uniref:HNH endonuclease n=1 Tax=Rhizobium sp. AC44/96 TaxID=1841654 RepID=UPI00080FA711|nr:HNH endonuclease [Rhizobium sp. AC44/96]OCJ05299.1 hypothetical protein A6U87_14950 [Rhizobium sp. AC44/96]
MSNRAWMPLHVNMYVSQTLDLSAVEHGALLLLVIAHYRNGSLPDAPEQVRRLARLTPTQWSESRDRLLAFFAADEGKYSRADQIRGLGARRRVPKAMRIAVLERDGELCAYCGKTEGPFHIDHKTPWSLGGRHELENLCVSCESCNLAKSNIPYADWLELINE